MIYSLTIREHNKQAHFDIDKDIIRKQNGLFTFVIRVNNGNIVDYVTLETENYGRKQVSNTGTGQTPRRDRKGSK